MNFSLEIGPKTDLETVPPLSDVYITMLPGGDYKETADKAAELVKKGFNPVPHFPARPCWKMWNWIETFFNKLCCFICCFFIISSWKHSDIDIT